MAQYDLNLRDYWRILRKRMWSVRLVTAGLWGRSPSCSRRCSDPIRCTRPRRSSSSSGPRPSSACSSRRFRSRRAIPSTTQAAVVRSFPVLERAAKTLTPHPGRRWTPRPSSRTRGTCSSLSDLRNQVTATPEENTTLINIAVTSPDAGEAARLANAVAQAYQEENSLLRNRKILEARRFIEEQLRDGRRPAPAGRGRHPRLEGEREASSPSPKRPPPP